jgi:hypothetical protein
MLWNPFLNLNDTCIFCFCLFLFLNFKDVSFSESCVEVKIHHIPSNYKGTLATIVTKKIMFWKLVNSFKMMK